MTKNRRMPIFWIAIFFFLAGTGLVWGDDSESLKSAPDITLTDVNGKDCKLSDYRGKVVILNFWAVWCPPCHIEIPYLLSLYDKYKDNGLVVLGVAVSSGSDKKIKEKAKELGINYTVINGDECPSVRRKFYGEIRQIPNSYVINQEGKFYKHYVGFSQTTPDELEQDLKTLLNR